MRRELGFEFNDIWHLDFVQPFVLWPHIEVLTHDASPKMLAVMNGSPYLKYSPADIALLDDPAKCQVYIEAHAGCIAPRYCEIATILSTKSALMEPPAPSFLDSLYPHGVANWTRFSQGTLLAHMLDMAAFAHAWPPLAQRWEVEGASAITLPTTRGCIQWSHRM